MGRPRKHQDSDIYEAVDSFSTADQAGTYWFSVSKGQTFEAGHWLVRKHPHLFKLLQPRHVVPPGEQATDAPGEARDA